MKKPVVDPDVWYIDSNTNARFKLLSVGNETVDVVDEFGNRRTCNLQRWVADMKKETSRARKKTA